MAAFYASDTPAPPPGGHKECWGSWYDMEAKVWGFRCCKVTDRTAQCALQAEAPQPGPDDDSSGSDDSEDEANVPPPEVLDFSVVRPPESFQVVESFVGFELQLLLHKWAEGQEKKQFDVGSLPPECQFLAEPEALKKAQEHLGPLLRRLEATARSSMARAASDRKKRKVEVRCVCRSDRLCSCGAASAGGSNRGDEVDDSVVDKMEQLCASLFVRDYRKAEEIYYDLSIGKGRWPIGGVHLGYTQKVSRKVYVNHSSMDNEEVKNYLQAMKRLIVVGEFFAPNEDFSRNVHKLKR